jgi:hypothetical protein
MRKRLIFILALTCMMILTMSFGSVSTAFAADGDGTDEYGYVIKIYPGLKGTYQGKSDVTTLNKKLGDSVYITADDVKVNDDRYYVRGFRVAGHDNDESEGESIITGFWDMNFDVKEDVNYEVAYGIRGEMVPYTVRYIDDATGSALIGEDTHYGMPGDKPVVSYKYIEGYEPNVYYLAKRLTKTASENIYEFRYTKGPGTTTTTVNRTTGNNPAAPGTAANPAGTNVGPAAAANNAGANNGTATIGDNGTPLADGPQQFTDIDGQDVPMADGSFHGIKNILPYLIGGLVALLIVLALLWFILHRKKDEAGQEV